MPQTSAFTRDDLRAGVAAGVLTEAQAARLLTIAEARTGVRDSGEDEPFELFRGFAEVFVSVGLVLLMTGLLAMASLVALPFVVLVAAIALTVGLAVYFTSYRRMVLPSVVLVSAFAASVAGLTAWAVGATEQFAGAGGTAVAVVTGLALLVWFRAFRVPFAMFLVGLCGLMVVFAVTRTINPTATLMAWRDVFDISRGSGLAVGTLVFGVAAFAAAMWFDMRDPHRLGRRAASGFWLHLLAAPALVNTIALSFYNMQNTPGFVLLGLSMLLTTLLALVIDRRSFLTAGIGYLAVLIALVLPTGKGNYSWIGVVLVLGIFVTVLGAFWTQIRASLMRVLPEFPGKHRLPPYSE